MTTEDNQQPSGTNEEKLRSLYTSLRADSGIPMKVLLDKMQESGFSKEDSRLQICFGEVLKQKGEEGSLDEEEFRRLFTHPNSEILRKTLRKELVIPDFQDFRKDIQEIFNATKEVVKGEMNELLPHPAPERQPAYAVSVCTVDGQLLQLGDHDLAFVVQSIIKPINYALAYEENGKEKLHQHVGIEPGDESFSSTMVLNEDNLPHNPMITSGAIMTSSLVKPDLSVGERLQHVMKTWEKMTGGRKVSYNEESFEMERKNADNHFALAHIMNEQGAFPEGADLETEIEFYLKCCAIEVNIDDLAHAAASLANYGKCPSTGTKVFQHDTVRDTLSLMLSSGLYSHSGEFAYQVGLPAKSGIGGGIMIVIPELMGIAVYSPPLDSHNNSARGVKFCEKLVEKFNFHKYDALGSDIHGKKDPRKPL